MSETIAIQAQINADVQARATAVLQREGLTLADAVTILLIQTAERDSFPLDTARDPAYDAWVRSKVQSSLNDTSPDTPNHVVASHFRQRKADLLRRIS